MNAEEQEKSRRLEKIGYWEKMTAIFNEEMAKCATQEEREACYLGFVSGVRRAKINLGKALKTLAKPVLEERDGKLVEGRGMKQRDRNIALLDAMSAELEQSFHTANNIRNGLTRNQLNQVMLELQERAVTNYEQCEIIGMKDRDYPYYAGIYHGLTDAGRILARASGIEGVK